MGLFDSLFGKTSDSVPQPDIRFGRYSDSYKAADHYKSWDLALEKFESDLYLDSYREFFKYLRDEREDNVVYWEENGGIRFELFQGSKKICGFADPLKLRAEAKVAQTESLNVGFLRRLIEQNYSLKYSRFAIDPDSNLTIVFDTYTLDGSPYKLYFALKELATHADKQDDLLLEEFNSLKPVDSSHLEDLPEAEKEVKYQYIQKEIKSVLNEIEEGQLSKDQYPGGIAYLLLNLVYKLDYLIKPEGYTMETLERINRLYFTKDEKNTAQKNQMLCKEFQKLIERPKAEFFKEMYRVKTTFGITLPVNHDRVVSFIDGELNHMDWYFEHGHQKIALAVPGYIVGYCMFTYAVPKPINELFHLYFQVIEADFFRQLGFTCDYYNAKNKTFNKRSIRKAIQKIETENKLRFTRMHAQTGLLNFDSIPEFAKSFLMMVRNMDLTKID